MARDSVIRVQTNQTLLAVDLRVIGELWALQNTCIRKMGLITGEHVTLAGSDKLRAANTMLGREKTFVQLSALTREG